jgi:hypothetical protein
MRRLLQHGEFALADKTLYHSKAKIMGRESVFLLLLLCEPAVSHAQWLHYPTRGTPRTPDGKPKLAAKAPRAPNGKPDFPESGSPSIHLQAKMSAYSAMSSKISLCQATIHAPSRNTF